MRMNPAGIIVAIALLATGCAQAAVPVTVAQGTAENALTWNFGTVKEGSLAMHDFEFRNDGATTLTIKDVFASCGCTTPKAAKKVLAPGESTTISVTFDSRGFSGPVEKFVYISTDRAAGDVTKLTIKASVTP